MRGLLGARAVRVLLAFFLVPVVVFSTPTHAMAAATGWQGVSLTFPGIAQLPGSIECWLAVRLTEHGAFEAENGECWGTADISPGFKQKGEHGTPYALWVQGVGCSGEATGTMGQHAEDGIWSMRSVIPYASYLPGSDCDPATVCLKLTAGDSGGEVVCASVFLDPLENVDPDSDCIHGKPLSAVGDGAGRPYPGQDSLWYNEAKITIQLDRLTSTGWLAYSRWRNSAGAEMIRVFTVNPGVQQTVYSQATQKYNETIWDLVGVQLTPLDSTLYDGVSGYEHLTATTKKVLTGDPNHENYFVYPQDDTTDANNSPWGVMGTTDTRVCAFWVGEDVTNQPATHLAVGSEHGTHDPFLPAGEITPPESGPAPTAPNAPGADDTPEPTDDLSFWAQILKAIRALGQAIAGIAQSILAGIERLFVPDASVISGEVGELKDAWAKTPPFVVVDGVQDLAGAFTIPPAGDSCSGPPLSFSTPLTGAVTLSMLDTCKPAMANLASLVKTALTVLVYVGGFLAAVRIIGGAFGLDLRLERGGDE